MKPIAPSWIYRRPELYSKQESAIFHPARYAIIEATPKSGKTVGCMVWILEQCLQGRPGQNYWWVAPVLAQAEIAFRRFLLQLPKRRFVATQKPPRITLPNGAVLSFKSADNPDSLFGEDVHAAVIDEAPRCKPEAWHAVRSTLTSTRGPARIIGNVKGRRNWAYQLARQAEGGKPDMHYARLTALDAIEGGIFDEAELHDAERLLPQDVFRELYFAEASDDAGNPFGLVSVREGIRPLSAAQPVAWGWDLGKSVDWTVGIALDADGDVCRFVRFQRNWTQTVEAIRRATGQLPALVDSTGVGDPILEDLQATAGGQFEGFKFSAPSKQQLMQGLALAIQGQRVHYPDGPIVMELEAFEFSYTKTGVRYTAPEGIHDDCVVALALAVQKCEEWRRTPPLELLFAGSVQERTDGTSVERAVRKRGSWFPGD